MKRTGTVELPLHGGKAPRWLFDRMVKLSSAITEALIYEYNQEELEKEIDKLVYGLYDLDKKDQKVIEKFLDKF